MELIELLAQRLQGEKSEAGNPRHLTLNKRHAYAHDDQLDKNLTYFRGLQPDDEDKSAFLNIARTADVIGPALDRYVAGVVGLDPEWTIKRTDSDITSDALARKETTPEERALATELNELENMVTGWHKDAKLHRRLKTAYRHALWGGFGELRLYLPDSYADDPRAINRTFTFEEALNAIYLSVSDPRTSGPVRDEHGNTIGHYYEYEGVNVAGNAPATLVEVHDPQFIRTYEKTLGTQGLKERVDLYPNGQPAVNPFYKEGQRPEFLMHTLEHDKGGLLTESIIDEQDSINESKTEMRRNGRLHGHRQGYTINATAPLDEATGKEIPYTTGAAVILDIQGNPITYADGHVEQTSPEFGIVDGVDPDNFIKAIQHHTFEILKRWNQAHFEADYLAISGESKRESRDSWETNLEMEAEPVKDALSWVIMAAGRFASWLANENPNRFEDYEVVPRLNLTVSSADMATVIQASDLVERGHMSLEALIEMSPLIRNKEAEKEALEKSSAPSADESEAVMVQ